MIANSGCFSRKKYLVLGLAKSGYAAARLLHRLGAEVVVNDFKSLQADPHAQELRRLGIEVIDAGHPDSLLERWFDVVVKNPGIRYDNPVVTSAIERHIPVVTEVEIAGRIARAPFIAITGSNGKTTTTTLIGEIMAEGGRHPLVAGNIGKAVCEEAARATEENVLVTELSSFQLLGTLHFHPHMAVLLNLFDAHLDYHGTRENYMKAKAKIFTNQSEEDFAVVNADDADVMRMASDASAQKILFSSRRKLAQGAYIDEGIVCFNGEQIVRCADIALPGQHNLENILAAVAVVKTYGVDNSAIVSVLKTFQGVKHRLQYVDTIEGRQFYNDSKATNILATQKALSAFTKPVILLAGGLDRGNDFEELVPALRETKAVVAFGETAPKIEAAAQQAGCEQIGHVEHVGAAVALAYEMSERGDVILLSPACASWDQHRTFEDRGDMFINGVHKLR